MENKNYMDQKFFIILISILLLLVILYTVTKENVLVWLSASLILGLASFSVGAIIGFLFGIPKMNVNYQTENKKEFLANTSLEQISDWLTKILIGLGLTQLMIIPNKLFILSNQIVIGITGRNQNNLDSTFILSLLIVFFIIGFFFAYFYARLLLKNKFIDVESYNATRNMLVTIKEKSENLKDRLNTKIDNERNLLNEKKIELTNVLSKFQKEVLMELIKNDKKEITTKEVLPYNEFIEIKELVKLNILIKISNTKYKLSDNYYELKEENL